MTLSRPVQGLLLVALGAALLLAHARLFDFICDDAYITFRYARNLAEHGAPLYNLDERVEGYTNFLWMILAAALFRAGATVPALVAILGAASAVLLQWGVWRVWVQLWPRARLVALFPLLGVAASVAVACWTLGGLETTLYAALLLWGVDSVIALARRSSSAAAVNAGVFFALASLTRPEGVAGMGLALLVLVALRRRAALRDALVVVGTAGLILVPFFVWRYSYYGAPLPNTFYLKTSGLGPESWRRGWSYLVLASRDHFPIAGIAGLLLLVPVRHPPGLDGNELYRARRALAWIARVFVLFFLLYAVSVGGDFLPLYRFFVPLVVLGMLAGTQGAVLLVERQHRSPRGRLVGVLAGVFTLSIFAMQQQRVGHWERTAHRQIVADAGVEYVKFTRTYALRWGATGRWIAAHARPGDRMAIGAAGAMPYFAGIPSTDVLGLCDAWVARHGDVNGTRPGHQRHAPLDYTLSKRPVFLFEEDEMSDEAPKDIHYDKNWGPRGYTWVVVRILESADKPFFYKFLMRIDRAYDVWTDPDVVAVGYPFGE